LAGELVFEAFQAETAGGCCHNMTYYHMSCYEVKRIRGRGKNLVKGRRGLGAMPVT
jgi:hypothetical protein